MVKNKAELFSKALNMGIHPDVSFDEKKRLRVINQILFISSIIPLLYIFLFAILKLEELYTIEIILSLTSLIGYLLKGKHKQKLSKFILLFIIPLELFYFPVFVGNIGAEFFFFIFVVVGYNILDKKSHLVLLTVFLTVVILVSKYFLFNYQYPEEYKILETLCYYPNLLISVVLISLSTYMYKNDSIRYQNKIEEQQKELKIKVQELEKREKILSELLNELNNRVNNNLQIISSLFTFQIYNSKTKEVITALKAARYRIDVISILYQHLHNKKGNIKPNLKKYINELSQYELQMSGIEDSIELDLKIDDVYMKIEIISHIGLLVNELFTNIFKYGIRGDKAKCKVAIVIQKNDNAINLKVSDNGNGFTEKALMKRKDTFGMKLVYTIAQQYSGEVNIYNNNGAHINIKLLTD